MLWATFGFWFCFALCVFLVSLFQCVAGGVAGLISPLSTLQPSTPATESHLVLVGTHQPLHKGLLCSSSTAVILSCSVFCCISFSPSPAATLLLFECQVIFLDAPVYCHSLVLFCFFALPLNTFSCCTCQSLLLWSKLNLTRAYLAANSLLIKGSENTVGVRARENMSACHTVSYQMSGPYSHTGQVWLQHLWSEHPDICRHSPTNSSSITEN